MQFNKVFIAVLPALCFSGAALAQAMPSHTGHGGGSGDDACIRAKISHYTPEHLASVKPGSAFSFTVSGSNGPKHIHVSIRQEPLKVAVEDKDTFYLVKGVLPENFKNETVRISVQVKAKFSKCDTDGGLLLKVTE
ncbi:MAG: hypothetical protein ABSB19_00320 [Methylomonas sp.]|jgi:hypothetical protein